MEIELQRELIPLIHIRKISGEFHGVNWLRYRVLSKVKIINDFADGNEAAFPARSTIEETLRGQREIPECEIQSIRCRELIGLSIYRLPSDINPICWYTPLSPISRFPYGWILFGWDYRLENIRVDSLGSPTHPTDVIDWPVDWTPLPIHTIKHNEDRVRHTYRCLENIDWSQELEAGVNCQRADELVVERVLKRNFLDFIASKWVR